MEEEVTIPKSEYDQLINDQKTLHALHAGGVDNWEWYSDSLRDAGLIGDDEDE